MGPGVSMSHYLRVLLLQIILIIGPMNQYIPPVNIPRKMIHPVRQYQGREVVSGIESVAVPLPFACIYVNEAAAFKCDSLTLIHPTLSYVNYYHILLKHQGTFPVPDYNL